MSISNMNFTHRLLATSRLCRHNQYNSNILYNCEEQIQEMAKLWTMLKFPGRIDED